MIALSEFMYHTIMVQRVRHITMVPSHRQYTTVLLNPRFQRIMVLGFATLRQSGANHAPMPPCLTWVQNSNIVPLSPLTCSNVLPWYLICNHELPCCQTCSIWQNGGSKNGMGAWGIGGHSTLLPISSHVVAVGLLAATTTSAHEASSVEPWLVKNICLCLASWIDLMPIRGHEASGSGGRLK